MVSIQEKWSCCSPRLIWQGVAAPGGGASTPWWWWRWWLPLVPVIVPRHGFDHRWRELPHSRWQIHNIHNVSQYSVKLMYNISKNIFWEKKLSQFSFFSSCLPWAWSWSACRERFKQLDLRRRLKQPASACDEWGGEALRLPLPRLHRGGGKAGGQPLLQEVHQQWPPRQRLLLRAVHPASHPGQRGHVLLLLLPHPQHPFPSNHCLPCTGVQTACIKTIRMTILHNSQHWQRTNNYIKVFWGTPSPPCLGVLWLWKNPRDVFSMIIDVCSTYDMC